MQEGITTTMDTRATAARTDSNTASTTWHMLWNTAVQIAGRVARLAATGAAAAWRSLVLRERRSAPAPQIAQALDIDALSAQLAVEQRGEADGRAELPGDTDQPLSGTQKEIIHYFCELQRQAQQKVAAAVDSLRDAGDQIGLSDAISALRDIPSRVENDIRRLAAEHQQQLAFLQEREAQHAADYAEFRKTHQLQRAAQYSGMRWLYFVLAVTLALGCIVAVVNVVPVHAQAAFAVSTGNLPILALLAGAVLLPYAIGAGLLRSINHIGFGEQLIGWLGGALALVLIGAVALFSGHHVIVLGTAAADPLMATVEAVMTAPLALQGAFEAWTVAGAVAASGLIALVLGYASDDPYPDYGAVQRAFYASQRELESFTRRRRSQINAIADRAEREVQELAGRVKTQVRQYMRMTDSLRRLPATLGNYASALEDACNILLERYRAANLRTRSTVAPASFAENFCFGPEQDQTGELLALESSRLDQLQQGVVQLEDELARTRQLIRDSNSRAIGDLNGTI